MVEYFVEHGSSVYISALDISKASDRVNYHLLLLKLIEANVPDDIALMCAYWFRHLVCVVVWEGVSSEPFNILSGVHQGGLCSCWFFNVCINDLIKDLEQSCYGC